MVAMQMGSDDAITLDGILTERIWSETIGVQLEIPFQRMTYVDSMLRYGTDKPDLRFGLGIAFCPVMPVQSARL